jgi:hypothetical protein
VCEVSLDGDDPVGDIDVDAVDIVVQFHVVASSEIRVAQLQVSGDFTQKTIEELEVQCLYTGFRAFDAGRFLVNKAIVPVANLLEKGDERFVLSPRRYLVCRFLDRLDAECNLRSQHGRHRNLIHPADHRVVRLHDHTSHDRSNCSSGLYSDRL